MKLDPSLSQPFLNIESFSPLSSPFDLPHPCHNQGVFSLVFFSRFPILFEFFYFGFLLFLVRFGCSFRFRGSKGWIIRIWFCFAVAGISEVD